ncbi:hypothetical protein ACVV38_12090 [Escherichia coli]
MTATAVEKPECTLYCKHFRDEVKIDAVSPIGVIGERNHCEGLLSGGIGCWKKTPTLEVQPDRTGANLRQNNSGVAQMLF